MAYVKIEKDQTHTIYNNDGTIMKKGLQNREEVNQYLSKKMIEYTETEIKTNILTKKEMNK